MGDYKLKYKVLMIGRNRGFIKALEKENLDIELYIFEEHDLHEIQIKEPFNSKIIKEVRTGEYQQSDKLLRPIIDWHEEVKFDVVLPGVEYAVQGAGRVAKALGLKYLGDKAVESLTNKLRLRQLCTDFEIPHPNFVKVNSIEDIYNFFDGRKIVIKPANRQASTGVIKVEHKSDINKSFEEMIRSSEGTKIANRLMEWEYMAEDYIEGDEISVETLIKDGEIIFHNITGKTTTNGRYFVELGHVVPAILDNNIINDIYRNQDKLVSALEARDGFLHAEWKLTNEGPKLIECAGRIAGDKILDLIEQAYGFNLYGTIIKILIGDEINIPQKATNGASIRFFEPPTGKLDEIYGMEILNSNDPNIIDWSITIKQGDIITPFASSWSRVGYVFVIGKDNYDAVNRAEKIVKHIVFKTVPVRV